LCIWLQIPAAFPETQYVALKNYHDGRILVAADGAGLNVLQLSNTFFEKDAAPIITRLTLLVMPRYMGWAKITSEGSG
jgi:hypothetical protein